MLKPVLINITYPKIKQAAMDYAEYNPADPQAPRVRTKCCN